jgi:putative adhesin
MFRVATLVVLCAIPLAALAEDDCAFRADRSLDVDAKGLSQFKLDTGAGDLVVEGVTGLAKIEVRGKACASDEKVLAGIQLVQERQGSIATVGTRIPDNSGIALFESRYTYMDVHVRMPAGLKLDLRDSSGDLEVSGLTNGLDLKDSSGDIKLRDLAGDINVTDTSGDIEASKISGNFTVLSDSSGDIIVDDVKGSAVVEEDSSGDISLRHVGGDARVDRDSSGDINFSDIGRDAVVGVDGSGDITADGVKGNFTVGAKSSSGGEIRQHDVHGQVSLPPSG